VVYNEVECIVFNFLLMHSFDSIFDDLSY